VYALSKDFQREVAKLAENRDNNDRDNAEKMTRVHTKESSSEEYQEVKEEVPEGRLINLL